MKNQKPPVAPDARIAEVVSLRLRDAGHPNPTAWEAGLHPDTHRADLTQQAQRFHVNRRLRTMVGKYEENTLAVRTALIDDGDTEDWARHLDKVVIPCIIRNETVQCSETSSQQTPA